MFIQGSKIKVILNQTARTCLNNVMIISFVLSTVIFLLSFSDLLSKPNYSKSNKYYTDTNIVMFAQRIDIQKKCLLKQVKLKVYSKLKESYFRLRLFSNEGGNSFPIYEYDLCNPITYHTDTIGVHILTVPLPDPIELNYDQYFICLDSVGPGIFFMSSEKPVKKYCSSESGDYLYQSMKYRQGNWVKGKYRFACEGVYDTLDQDKSDYFSKNTIEKITCVDSLANKNICIVDVDRDGLLDVLVDNKLYMNNSGLEFTENTNYRNSIPIAQRHLVLDINNDGVNEVILLAPNEEKKIAIYKIISKSIYSLQSDLPVDDIESVSDFYLLDLNNDGFKELIVEQEDTCRSKFLFFRNIKGKLEYSSTFICNQADLKSAKIFPLYIDDDKLIDIVLVDSNSVLKYYRNMGAFNFFLDKTEDSKLEVSSINNLNSNECGNNSIFYLKRRNNLNTFAFDNTVAYAGRYGMSNLLNVLSRENFDDRLKYSVQSDINNDGYQDLLLLTNDCCRNSLMLKTTHNSKLSDITFSSGIYNSKFTADVLMADMDSDGQLDIVTYDSGSVVVYLNKYDKCENKNSYLTVDDHSNQISKVKVMGDNTEYSYTQNYQRASNMLYSGPIQIGIGNTKNIDTVLVEFNDRTKQIYTNLSGNHLDVSIDSSRLYASKVSYSLTPNPFTESLYIRVDLSEALLIKISILNVVGEEKHSVSIEGVSGANNYTWNGLDMHNNLLESGVYIVQIQVGDTIYKDKIIKIN